MQYGAKQQAVDRIMRQADAAYNGDVRSPGRALLSPASVCMAAHALMLLY